MCALLALSLGAASWLTGAPLHRPAPATADPVSLEGATFNPPPGWVLSQTLVSSQGVAVGWELIDTTLTGRRLRIFKVAVPSNTSPQTVLSGVLPKLIAGRRPITRFKTPEDGPNAKGTFELFFSTRRLSLTGTNGSPQIHAIAALRPDPERCWVIQLTSLTPDDRWSQEAEIQQLHQLRNMLSQVTFDPA